MSNYEYMVVYICVVSGKISEVYKANKKPTNLEKADEVNDPGVPFDIKGFKNDKTFATFYTETNPLKCRYIHMPNCQYRKVCKQV